MTTQDHRDRNQIISNPVTAYRALYRNADTQKLQAISQLAERHDDLKRQHQDIQAQTQKLSRLIGTAKKQGEPIDTLIHTMQEHSAQLKAIVNQQLHVEEDLLKYFDLPPAGEESPNPPAPAFDTHRYSASAVDEQDLSIEHLDAGLAEWNTYVASNPAASIYHRSEWRELIHKTFGHDCLYLLARDRNKGVVGVLPLAHLNSRLFGNFMISMPYFNYGGAVADHPLIEQRLMEAANAHAAQAGIDHIEYRDTLPREGLPVRSNKVCMLLTLPKEQDVLWHSFSSKLRAQIRRPQREQPDVRCGGLECLDDFYAVFTRNMRDLGTPVYGKAFFRNILQTFTEHSRIISIHLHNRPVAAAFLLGYRGRLEIPWASSIRQVNHLSMNMLLYWEVLKFAIDHQYTVFDFGRSSRDSGTYRFKQQWGAQPVQLYWHYWLNDAAELPELNPDNPKYALAISLWKRLPVPVANRIGPSLVKYLP